MADEADVVVAKVELADDVALAPGVSITIARLEARISLRTDSPISSSDERVSADATAADICDPTIVDWARHSVAREKSIKKVVCIVNAGRISGTIVNDETA